MYVDNTTDWGTITVGTSGGSISGTGTSNGSIYPSGKGPGAPSTGLGGNYSSSASATTGTLSVRYVATIRRKCCT